MAKCVYESDSGNDRPTKLPRGEILVPSNYAMIEQIHIRELFGSDDEEVGVEDNDEENKEDEEGDQEPWFVDTFSYYDADEESDGDDDGSVIDLTYQSE
ncbi:hypothetical protein PF002_g15980 [Phytophthora fragariae]|uniref:Uncharacterized protein n=1 Tax=Phytophthora fragariae TaxID=53985 RepID=A0A6A3YJZ6_9STRA|nr:hypothetical protein PF011_g14055 [Phytophthora fragariae]KAE9195557.1 hypothetical protein PF004_g20398 [Phytophthora fragariae]KAE9220130.1 hypothetical protein PF002_g15980 [Phytophthora fragariae]